MLRRLPRINSPAYHVLLAAVAVLILGPLVGISAAYMSFSVGFFVGGSTFSGIVGSLVTLPYGPEGKHGANYVQTMAASISGMCVMAVLVQAMVWMGLPQPPAWQLALYFMSIGMFGVGVGMLYTPMLVDRMQLPFPSGYAVANILRALTDKQLLRLSLAKLGGGMLCGYAVGTAASEIPLFTAVGLSPSTIGAGLIVGARIAIPALVLALIGFWQRAHLVAIGWLEPGAPFRRIGFIVSLGAIFGAAIVDVAVILSQLVRRQRGAGAVPLRPPEDWKRVNGRALAIWILFWGVSLVWIGSQVLHQPIFFLLVAVVLSFALVLVNGISQGISDWSHISSAFVLTIFIFAGLGLRDPSVGLMCAAIILIACQEGGDMQQDRSTGWRLGTNRVVQFRYQAIGIAVGAVLAVALAKVFMRAYPVLQLDQFGNPNIEGATHWQSAMTYKIVGALRGLTATQPQVKRALRMGISVGLLVEISRKLLKGNKRYQVFARRSATGRVCDFLLDAVFLPSPYAFSFGGFVELPTVIWWTAGGVIASLHDLASSKSAMPPAAHGRSLPPSDVSTTALLGGGLIAGDSLAALAIGLWSLLKTMLRGQ